MSLETQLRRQPAAAKPAAGTAPTESDAARGLETSSDEAFARGKERTAEVMARERERADAEAEEEARRRFAFD